MTTVRKHHHHAKHPHHTGLLHEPWFWLAFAAAIYGCGIALFLLRPMLRLPEPPVLALLSLLLPVLALLPFQFRMPRRKQLQLSTVISLVAGILLMTGVPMALGLLGRTIMLRLLASPVVLSVALLRGLDIDVTTFDGAAILLWSVLCLAALTFAFWRASIIARTSKPGTMRGALGCLLLVSAFMARGLLLP